jgi:hypothetical protein
MVFRNVFDGTVRDHAITTFVEPDTVGAIHRLDAGAAGPGALL